MIIVPNSGQVKMSIRVAGERVVIIKNGELVAEVPWQQAKELGRAIGMMALKAEEHAKHEQVTQDQALLMRAGCPVGFSDDRRIVHDAYNEAQHNRDLRRYIKNPPASIKSREKFGTPTLTQEKLPK